MLSRTWSWLCCRVSYRQRVLQWELPRLLTSVERLELEVRRTRTRVKGPVLPVPASDLDAIFASAQRIQDYMGY